MAQAPDGFAEPYFDNTQSQNAIFNAETPSHVAPGTSETIKDGSGDYFDAGGREKAESLEKVQTQSYDAFSPEDVENIRRIASRPTFSSRASTYRSDGLERKDTLAGLELGDPVFDPNSSSFDLHKYLRMTMKILDDEDIKTKRAGAVFKNVNVSGTGSALNLQPTVSSFFMTPLRLGESSLFGHTPLKKILRDFDGLIRGGELLIVLGRPGSGCSTFLKTLTGGMHGLDLDKQSTVH